MAVRRLAEIQPDRFDFTPENQVWVDRQLAKYPPGRQASAVMPLLRRAQAQHGGWLPKPAIEKVADLLSMPYIRVLEIATFYSMYNLAPVGRYFIQFCGTTPCMLRGADAIKAVLEQRIGASGHVGEDGLFSWLEVECLGACCNAPMVQINDDYFEDLTAENFGRLLDDLAAGRPVKTGSLIGRLTSEPLGGLTSLITIYGPDGREDKFGPPAPPEQPAVEGSASAEAATPAGAPAETSNELEAPSAPDHSAVAAEQADQAVDQGDLGHGGLHGPKDHSIARPESQTVEVHERVEDPVAQSASGGTDAPAAAALQQERPVETAATHPPAEHPAEPTVAAPHDGHPVGRAATAPLGEHPVESAASATHDGHGVEPAAAEAETTGKREEG